MLVVSEVIMKNKWMMGILVFGVVLQLQSHQDYTRNSRMPLFKRAGIATLSVASNTVMGGLVINKGLKYLTKSPSLAFSISMVTAGTIALVNEYIQIKRLYEYCKESGKDAHKYKLYWANEDQYAYSAEKYYFDKKLEALSFSLGGAAVWAAICAGVIFYCVGKNAELAKKAFIGAASKIYWFYAFGAVCERKLDFF